MTQSSNDIIQNSSPLLYDKIAQELNDEMNCLGYIDDLYPVCSIGEEEDQTYPEVYQNDGTKVNLRVMPDSTKSLSFFIVEGDLQEIDEDDLIIPMAYVVWMNLTKVDPARKYDYTEEVIRKVYNVIKDYGGYDISVNINSPLEGFTMLEGNTVNMRPYSAFKVSFNKNMRVCL